MIRDANEGKLPQYSFYRQNQGLRDFANLRNVQWFVRECLNFQRDLAVTHLVSPTICIENFTDRTTQIALSLAQEAIDYNSGNTNDRRPLLVSFVFSEVALGFADQVSEFLDTISLFEADGFYLVVDRSSPGYSQDFQSLRLAQVIRMIYSLKRSRFQIICGYSDFVNLLYGSVGADAGATGWSQKLRRFSRSRFLPSTGGRQPRDRYSSSKLLNSIYLTELDACQDAGQLRAVKSDTPYDRRFDGKSYPSGVSWSPEDKVLQHWASISKTLENVAVGNTGERIRRASAVIEDARSLYAKLSRLGVGFEAPNGQAHLGNWAEAISNFQSSVRV
jgi:hypothetical protein